MATQLFGYEDVRRVLDKNIRKLQRANLPSLATEQMNQTLSPKARQTSNQWKKSQFVTQSPEENYRQTKKRFFKESPEQKSQSHMLSTKGSNFMEKHLTSMNFNVGIGSASGDTEKVKHFLKDVAKVSRTIPEKSKGEFSTNSLKRGK